MEQVLIFANPIAGRGKARELAGKLVAGLRDLYRVTCFLTPPATVQWRPTDEPVRAAIVIGGDGTLRAVARRAIDFAAEHGCPPWPLLIVPLGTANLMGKHLGIAWNDQTIAAQVAAALQRRQIVHLDVARAAGGAFLIMASVGFDAWVVQQLDAVRRGPIRQSDYVKLALRSLVTYTFPPVRVFADGQTILHDTPALVVAGNIPEYGTGFPVLPYARPDDGLLDLCIMPCASRMELFQWFFATAMGEHIHREGVIYRKVRHVRVEATSPLAVQVDGEPAGQTPVDIDLLPWRIPFIVPANHE